MAMASDLWVEPKSQSLEQVKVDVIVSGSIAAVDSVRFIRCLRRLGAQVCPWLTKGGAAFVTETSLAWAANHKVVRRFTGTFSHLAQKDALVIAPASSSLLAKIAAGQTDSPASALAASYLGLKKQVLVVPCMHESLYFSPFVQRNLENLMPHITVVQPRREEGKCKFPDSEVVADIVSHYIQKKELGAVKPKVLITLGSTVGAIDSIRYVSNYSSGATGSLIAEELYRKGFDTEVVAGHSVVLPKVATTIVSVERNDEMLEVAQKVANQGVFAGVFAAAVLDYLPINPFKGKIKSKEHQCITIEMKRTKKIIGSVQIPSGIKVGFKLESRSLKEEDAVVAQRYISLHGLSMLIFNRIEEVGASLHRAKVFNGSADEGPCAELGSKVAIAAFVSNHIFASYLQRVQLTPKVR